MSDPPATLIRIRPRPFQFGLRTALVVMTGAGVIFSLASYSIDWGVLVALPLVGACWTVLAIRAGRRRVAYHLASALFGGATALFIVFTFCWVTFSPISPRELVSREALPLPLSGAMAIFFCACVMRRRIRSPGTRAAFGAGVGCVYLTLLAWMVLITLFSVVSDVVVRGAAVPINDALKNVVLLVGGTVLWATLALPVMGPYAICACVILRAIHPAGLELTGEDRAVFDIVVQLGWEKRPSVLLEIVSRTQLPPEQAEEVLERLVENRVLRHSNAKGYHPG